MRIGAIVQARLNSSRLPGKVLKEVNGKPLLWYLLSSLKQSVELDCTILSISDLESDQLLADYALAENVELFRGPLENVAQRMLETIDKYNLDCFVRICGDSPLLDYRLVDEGVKLIRTGRYEVVSNIVKRTYPKGQSVEVILSDVYRDILKAELSSYEQEHVTAKIYSEIEDYTYFSMETVPNRGDVQLSVDTQEDFDLFARLIGRMSKPHWEYDWAEKVAMYLRMVDA